MLYWSLPPPPSLHAQSPEPLSLSCSDLQVSLPLAAAEVMGRVLLKQGDKNGRVPLVPNPSTMTSFSLNLAQSYSVRMGLNKSASWRRSTKRPSPPRLKNHKTHWQTNRQLCNQRQPSPSLTRRNYQLREKTKKFKRKAVKEEEKVRPR